MQSQCSRKIWKKTKEKNQRNKRKKKVSEISKRNKLVALQNFFKKSMFYM